MVVIEVEKIIAVATTGPHVMADGVLDVNHVMKTMLHMVLYEHGLWGDVPIHSRHVIPASLVFGVLE
jgi:hypothetical protein